MAAAAAGILGLNGFWSTLVVLNKKHFCEFNYVVVVLSHEEEAELEWP